MNVEGLNTLHSVARHLGITPYISHNSNSKTLRYIDLFRSTFFIITFISCFIVAQYGKICFFGRDVHKSVLGTFSLMEFVATVLSIISVYSLNLRHGHRLQQFINGLRKLEVFIISNEEVKTANRRCLIEFYIWTMLGIALGCLSAYVYFSYIGWDIYKYFMWREFQNSHIIVVMDVITRYPKLIAYRMKELNYHLVNDVMECQNWFIKSSGTCTRKNPKGKVSIQMISEAYTSIAQLIEEYNEVIGPICLSFCSHMILNILVPVNMALLLVHGISVHSGRSFGCSFVVFCVFWVLFPCIIGIKLFTVCGQAEKEIAKVPRLCYSLIQTLGNNEISLKNELQEYANQANQLKPQFSAAGFFNINHGLTITIFGSVFTYVIVLSQFESL